MGLHNLKPCPFCGGDADKHIDDYGEGKFYVTVRCSKCGAKVFRKGAIEAVTEEAVNAWNRRADEVKGGFDGTEWERLLLLFLLSSTDPPRREITVRAESGGKTVNVTYDPHDAEAVKAAEVWRKALFADGAQFKAVAPVAVKDGDSVTFEEPPRKEVVRIATKMRMDELRKASEPLRAYLKAHGDPHTSVTVTQDDATERQDERGVKFEGESDRDKAARMIEAAIKATNQQTDYDRGFRNALRYAAYLLGGKEPEYFKDAQNSGDSD